MAGELEKGVNSLDKIFLDGCRDLLVRPSLQVGNEDELVPARPEEHLEDFLEVVRGEVEISEREVVR